MKVDGAGEAIALYEPSPEALRKLGEVSLYAFVGPSGSGKDSIMNRLAEIRPKRFARVVGDTSRRRRAGEVEGDTYHFRTKQEMKRDLLAQRFVQVVPGFSGNFYGTRPQQYPVDKLAMMAVQARVMKQFMSFGFKDLKWLQIVPHSDEEWQHWQKDQSHSPEDNAQRMEEAISSYSLSLTNKNTLFVLNDEIESATERVIEISNGQRPADEQTAKSTAVRNLEALKKRLSAN